MVVVNLWVELCESLGSRLSGEDIPGVRHDDRPDGRMKSRLCRGREILLHVGLQLLPVSWIELSGNSCWAHIAGITFCHFHSHTDNH